MKVAWTIAPVDPRREHTAHSTRMPLATGGRPELEGMLARMFVSGGANRRETWMLRLTMGVSGIAVNRCSVVRALVNSAEPFRTRRTECLEGSIWLDLADWLVL